MVEYVLALALVAAVAFVARDLWLGSAQNSYQIKKSTLNYENYQPLFATPAPSATP